MNNKKIFIALTANKDFWHKTNKNTMLGYWCVQDLNQRDEFQILPYHLKTNEDFFSIAEDIDKLYEKYLIFFCIILNNFHNVSHSKEYWEIVIGVYLHLYIQIFYERFRCIKNLLDTHKEFESLVLDVDKNFTIIMTTIDFRKKTQTDDYNLEIYSRILKFFNKNLDTQENSYQDFTPEIDIKKDFFKKILTSLLKVVSIFKMRKDRVLLQNSYLSVKNILKFAVFSKFRIEIRFDKSLGFLSVEKYNKKRRSKIAHLLPGDSDFEIFMKTTMPFDIPVCYMENYKKMNDLSSKYYPLKAPEIVFSSNSIYYDELFKLWIANNRKETKYIGIQHGGSYGILKYLFEESYERKCTDYYCTWGWKSSEYTVPVGSTKLLGYSDRRPIRSVNSKILFMMTSRGRYFSDLRNIPTERVSYFLNQRLFLDSVSEELWPLFKIRAYNDNESKSLINLWKNYYTDIIVEGWDVKLTTSFKEVRLVISDNMGTTFLESLKMNIPTIVFFTEGYPNSTTRKDAKIYFQKLEDSSILFRSPEAAAIFVNKIYKDIDVWWLSVKVQQARMDFCNNFTKTPRNFVRDFDNFFENKAL